MDYLIVYAHPNPKSFNRAVRDKIEHLLEQGNRSYAVRDLYSLRFDPVLSANDFFSFSQGTLPQDIKQEQVFVRQAQALIFIHPVWWYAMPALLKGYIDRVFSHGFAFRMQDGGVQGLLTGKKVYIFNTTGMGEEVYRAQGYHAAMLKAIDDGIFRLCGMEVVLHKFMYGVPAAGDEGRQAMLRSLHAIAF